MKTTITFKAADNRLPPLILEVEFSAWTGEPMVMYGDNPYPGSPPGVEVDNVVC